MNRLVAITTRIATVGFALSILGTSPAQVWEKPIAPGVTYRMEVNLAIPRIIHAIRFSQGAPGMSLKSELGGGTVIEENTSKGRETVSEMQARTGAIVAFNGDFFPFTGVPLGAMVRDGQLVSVPNVQRSVFGWGAKSAQMGMVEFKGTIEAGTQTFSLDGLNEECPLNEIVLNTDVAAFSLAKLPNVHAVLRMDVTEWKPNGTYVGTFENLYADSIKMPIQPGNAVLTANGTKADLLRNLTPGQKVTIKFQTKGFEWDKVDQLIGGGPFLVRNRQIAVDAENQGFNDAFSKKRHPRTAIGRTADGDIWLAVIDGRQKISDGATLEETARIMQKLGCTDAVNLDGGGSSAVNILGLLLNRPSDGKERPVANGVILLGPKPETTSAILKMKVPEKLILGQAVTLKVVDESGVLIPNADILWGSRGDAWLDQGGLARPIQKGKVDFVAYVRGQILRSSLVVVEPEKKPDVKQGKKVAKKKTKH